MAASFVSYSISVPLIANKNLNYLDESDLSTDPCGTPKPHLINRNFESQAQTMVISACHFVTSQQQKNY